MGAESQMSVTTTASVTSTILWLSGPRLFGDADRLVIVGGVVSATVAVNEPVAVLWCASVEVQLTVVVPSPEVKPLPGGQVTAAVPSTRSVAVAVYVTTAMQFASAETMKSDGI